MFSISCLPLPDPMDPVQVFLDWICFRIKTIDVNIVATIEFFVCLNAISSMYRSGLNLFWYTNNPYKNCGNHWLPRFPFFVCLYDISPLYRFFWIELVSVQKQSIHWGNHWLPSFPFFFFFAFMPFHPCTGLSALHLFLYTKIGCAQQTLGLYVENFSIMVL